MRKFWFLKTGRVEKRFDNFWKVVKSDVIADFSAYPVLIICIFGNIDLSFFMCCILKNND